MNAEPSPSDLAQPAIGPGRHVPERSEGRALNGGWHVPERSEGRDSDDAIAVLNRLLPMLARSLSAYLRDARPWTRPEQHAVRQALEHLAADQEFYARRVGEAIVSLGGRPEPGCFPIAWTAINDLSCEFLAGRVTDELRRQLQELRRAAAELTALADLRALAEEILGNVQGHLEIIEAATR